MKEQEALKSLDEFKKTYLPEQYKREQLDNLWKAELAIQQQETQSDLQTAKLIEAAEEVVLRWHTPLWSAEFIDKLALAVKESK
jgi:acetoin utilization deacetylase AcuC-like enzyme